MNHPSRFAALVLVALSALISAPRSASAQPCIPAMVLPSPDIVLGPIPVNLPAFGYTALWASPDDVHLTLSASGAEIPLQLAPGAAGDVLRLTPTMPLQEQATYELRYRTFCDSATAERSLLFTTSAAAPLPTALGTLTVQKATLLQSMGFNQFLVNLTWNIAPEMRPWAYVYTGTIKADYRAQTSATFVFSPDADLESAEIQVLGACGDIRDGLDHQLRFSVAPPAAEEALGVETHFTLDCPKSSAPPQPVDDDFAFPGPPPAEPGIHCSLGAPLPGRVPAGALAVAAGAAALALARHRRR